VPKLCTVMSVAPPSLMLMKPARGSPFSRSRRPQSSSSHLRVAGRALSRKAAHVPTRIGELSVHQIPFDSVQPMTATST